MLFNLKYHSAHLSDSLNVHKNAIIKHDIAVNERWKRHFNEKPGTRTGTAPLLFERITIFRQLRHPFRTKRPQKSVQLKTVRGLHNELMN